MMRYIHSREILQAVCRVFGVSHEDLTAPSRARRLVRARAAAVLLLREGVTPQERGPRSYPQLGELLGGRDHSTIIWAEMRAQEWLAGDPDFARALRVVRLILAGRPEPLPVPPSLVQQALADAQARRKAAGDPEDEGNCRDAIKRHCGSAGLLAAIAREFPARVTL